MAAIIGATAATNQKGGKKRRNRKENKLALVATIFLLIIGSLVPLGVILLSNYTGDSFPMIIIGIVFLVILGLVIPIVIIAETEYEEADDSNSSIHYQQDNLNLPRRGDRAFDENIHWGSRPSRRVDRYCSQCGSLLNFDDQFCYTCGRRIQ
jgi:hypothetical protein